MPNGFLTERPTARYGDTWGEVTAGDCIAMRFVCGGTGLFNVIELGMYIKQPDVTAPAMQGAIFTHDAGNNCPDIMVGFQTGTVTGVTEGWYFTPMYNTQVTGGVTYWICSIEAGNSEGSAFATGGTSLYIPGITPYNFPTGAAWHTHYDLSNDGAICAIIVPTRMISLGIIGI